MRTLYSTLFLIGLCACSDANPPRKSPAASTNVHVAVHESTYEVPDTIVTGRFAIVSDCLAFHSSDDGRTYLPVLPPGSRVDVGSGGAPVVSVNGTSLAELEQEVRLHGGPGFYGPAGQARPRQCPTEQIILSGRKG